MQARKLFTLTALSFALAACGTANNSPDQLVRNAFQRQFKQDSRYNFSGHLTAQLVDNKDAFVPTSASDTAALATLKTANKAETAVAQNEFLAPREISVADYAERAVAEVVTHKKAQNLPEVNGYNELSVAELMKHGAEESAATQTANESEKDQVEQRFVQHWFDSLSLRYQGAVDLPAARFELVPQMRYQTPHALSYIELPIQFNFQDWSIMTDPAAVAPYMDYALGKMAQAKPIQGKVLRVQLPADVVAELRRTVPFKSMLSTVPQAIDDAYASLGKDAFIRLEMDADGKKIGAAHRIGLKLDFDQSMKLSSALYASMARQLQDIAQNRPQVGFSEQDYAPLIKMLQQMGDVSQMQQPKKATAENENMKLALDNIINGLFKGYLSSNEMYVDRKGRLIAMRNETDMPKLFSSVLDEANRQNKTIRAKLWFEYDYSKPRFLLDPMQPNVVDGAQHYPVVGEAMKKLKAEDVRAGYAALLSLINAAENRPSETEPVKVQEREETAASAAEAAAAVADAVK
ncbi:hypothetical protein ACKLNO_07340 [Neisseriaceae bacterium B1]